MSEKDIKTLLENTSKKLRTIDLKEIIKSIVPVVEVNNKLGEVYKKKLKVHFSHRTVVCFYLHYVIYISLVTSGENIVTGKYVVETVVDKYLMERKETTKL